MASPDLMLLIRKFESHGALSAEDRRAVLELPFRSRTVPAGTYLVREGEPPDVCSVLLSGYAFRHKIVGNGGRQIVSLHIPGEAVDLQSLYLDCADHNVQTLTEAEIAVVPMRAMRALAEASPGVMRAVLMDMLVEASIGREWIANIGRRDARARLAHLLCEFACRMDAQGLTGGSYELPMTQEQIGDALGLTAVHVNRSIRAMEAEGLLGRNRRRIKFPDIERLQEAGDFNTLYLHNLCRSDADPEPG